MFIDISLSHSAVPASRWDRGTPYIRHSEIYYGREIYTRIINITKLPWVGFVLDNTGATTSCRRSERRTDHHNVLTLVTRVFLSLRLILLGDAHCSTCSIRRSRRYPRTRQTRWRTKPSSRIKCSFMDESIGGISSRVTVLPREWSCDHDCLVSRLICVRVSKLCTVDDTFFALKVPCFAAHCVLRIYVISLIIWYKKWFYSLDGSYIYIYIIQFQVVRSFAHKLCALKQNIDRTLGIWIAACRYSLLISLCGNFTLFDIDFEVISATAIQRIIYQCIDRGRNKGGM